MSSDLLCFSHIRWASPWRRPQALMTRAAHDRHVWFVEDPVDDETDSHLTIRQTAPGLAIVVPVLRRGLDRRARVKAQASVLRPFVESLASGDPLHWYYVPEARAYTAGLPVGAVVYDRVAEASATGAESVHRVWESELLAAADMVFTDSRDLLQSMRGRHPDTHLFPDPPRLAIGASVPSGQPAQVSVEAAWNAIWKRMHARIVQAQSRRTSPGAVAARLVSAPEESRPLLGAE